MPLMGRCTLSGTCRGEGGGGTLLSSTNKINHHDIPEILLKVELKYHNHAPSSLSDVYSLNTNFHGFHWLNRTTQFCAQRKE